MVPRVATGLTLALLVLLAGCLGGVSVGDPGATPTPTEASPATPTNGTLTVHFINVEQSVSTLVVGPTGETMLIDSGHFNDDGEYVLQYLQHLDIVRIDYFVTSHNDADHIGGNAAVIEYFETEAEGIGAVYDPGIAASTNTFDEYLDAVEQYEVTLYSTREGDSIPFEGVDVTVMGPPEPYIENEARNENSIVLKLVFGTTSFLFTGDAEDDQEAYLVETYGSELRATVMKAGHHGSKTSTGSAILDAAKPKVVVVSSAYDSQFGHPNEETLQRLAQRSIPTYWTATHGHVVLVSDGTEVSISTQRPAPTDPSALRDGTPATLGSTTPVELRAVLAGDSILTPTPDGGAILALVEVQADPDGPDGENLAAETVTVENVGDESLDMSGWELSDAAGATYTFPDGFVLVPGATVTIHTGTGEDTQADLYWNRGSPVWNNDGDTVIITNQTGDEVLREAY